jgi:hypothetical protein
MSRLSSIRNGLFVLVLTLAGVQVRAQQMGPVFVDQMSVLTGASVVAGASTPLTYTPGGEVDTPTIKNVITLGLSETSSAYFSDNFTVAATVTITYGTSSSSTVSFNQTLILSYNAEYHIMRTTISVFLMQSMSM